VSELQTYIFLVTQFIFPRGSAALIGLVLLIVNLSRSHSVTPQTIGLLWKSDQPEAEISSRQNTTVIREGYHRLRCDSNRTLFFLRLCTGRKNSIELAIPRTITHTQLFEAPEDGPVRSEICRATS
jgi:hypothetical protein